MFDFDIDQDLLTPAGESLLAALGIHPRSVRDSLADDLARRFPDREARPGES